MSNIIVKDIEYNDSHSLENVFTYIAQDSNLDNDNLNYLKVFSNVNMLTLRTAIRSFRFVKELYKKSSGNQLHHIIINLYKDGHKKLNHEDQQKWDIYYVIPTIAKYFNEHGFQFFGAIHNNTDIHHIHVVLNSIKYTDGNRMSNERSLYYGLLSALRNNCKQWNWEGVIYDKGY